jgi:hypothetical protein
MTPEEERLILSLTIVPGQAHVDTSEDVLRYYGTSNGRGLGLKLLGDAVEAQNGTDVEMAIIVCYTFGFGNEHLGLLLLLCSANWHQKHEDVVSMLAQLRAPEAVDCLYLSAQWIPEYLNFDDSRALATKAIWALGGTPGLEAGQALTRLLMSDNEVVQQAARVQLRRRKEG